jgi:hypothetical protein
MYMISFWICAAITAANSFVSLGFSIVGLRQADATGVVASRYALARSAAISLAAAIASSTGSVGFVAAVAIVMTVVQFADTAVGAFSRDRQKTFGPAVLALLNLAALVWLLADAL